MRIDQLAPTQARPLFESYGLTEAYFKKWEKEIHPLLCEVALDPAQIENLFKSVEKGAGRSALGRGADAVKGAADKISDVWFNKFGGMLQNSTPVQQFDQKFDQLKSSIAAKHPDLAAKLAKYGEFATEHPNWHKFLLAIAGSVAAAVGVAVAGGVGAGVLAVGTGTGVAVGILNIADRLLQGQKASTAIGRGATTGVVAGLAAGAAAKIGDMIKAGIKADAIGQLDGIKITNHTMTFNGQPFSAVTQEPLTSQLSNAFSTLDPSNAESVSNFAKLMTQASNPEYLAHLDKARGVASAIKAAAKSSMNIVSQLQKVAPEVVGGVASAATAQKPTESKKYRGTRLTESQLNELFGITGNKVDASALMKSWKKAGSPTDSEEVGKILSDGGVDPTVISTSFKEIGVAAPTSTGTSASSDSKIEPTMDAPTTAPTNTTNKEPTMAEPTTAPTTAPAGDQQAGNVDVSGLSKLLPSVGKNPTPFKAAVAAIKANKPLTPVMKSALGNAFLDMVYMEPGPLGQVSNILKKVSAPAQEAPAT